MTLNEFCEKNPQLRRPNFLKQELIDKATNTNLEKLHEKIHGSGFLTSRCWLPWILEHSQEILNDVYADFPIYQVPKSSQHTANERHYTDEELEKMIIDLDDIDF